jgi:hypothetical protein
MKLVNVINENYKHVFVIVMVLSLVLLFLSIVFGGWTAVALSVFSFSVLTSMLAIFVKKIISLNWQYKKLAWAAVAMQALIGSLASGSSILILLGADDTPFVSYLRIWWPVFTVLALLLIYSQRCEDRQPQRS